MNLDKIQINARIRTGWQALDLGFLMASAWWKTLFIAGAIPATIIFFIASIIFYDKPLIAVLILWWLKPFCEKLPLYYGSRRLFSVDEAVVNLSSSIRSIVFSDFLAWLLWRRLSPTRAFDLPVNVLEQLKGKSRSKRLQVLHGKFSDAAFANQFICFIFEIMVAVGLFLLISFFVPEDLDQSMREGENWSLIGKWVIALSAFVSILLVMPFHMMAGFALYLNRRIELEAWDIEISFRKLSERINQNQTGLMSLVFVFLLIIPMVMPINAVAQQSIDQPQARFLIDDVMAGEDFGQPKIVQQWRFKDWFEEAEEEDDKIPNWFIDLLEWLTDGFDSEGYTDGLKTTAGLLKLLLVIGCIVLIIYLLNKYKGPLRQFIKGKNSETPPKVMFGFDVTPESIPSNVVELVLAECGENRYREAIGLLYRASLSRLIARHSLKFRDSYTESECAQLVTNTGLQSLSQFFSELTLIWKRLAYGHVNPDLATVELLCQSWARELGRENQ